jgi:hypothetical protein
MRRALLLLLVVFLISLSCSHKLEGPPSPTVEPSALTYCGADTQSFVVKGGGLSPMVVDGAKGETRLEMPAVCLTRVKDAGGADVVGEPRVCVPEADVEWVSQAEIRFTARSGLALAPGTYDVTVENPDGKRAQGTVTLVVLADGPLAFWADPSVVYNGIATQITVYGSNLGVVNGVLLRDAANPELVTALDFSAPGERQNRVQVIVPLGQAVGTYDVVVTSANGCQAELLDGLVVTDTLGLPLAAIDPSFGFTQQPTPVTITGSEFQAVPRAYLNPETPAPGTVASALASVAFNSAAVLTGVVPPNLPAGKYDLIVVNPDGRVGVLESAFTVVPAAPPVVANVSPNYLDNNEPKAVTVEGSNFRNPSVTLACKTPDGATQALTGTVGAGGTATSFPATLPVNGLTQGTVCVVRVTNDDGSYYDYSAVGISNPASNLNAMIQGKPMAVARRAPAVSAGRATNAARFVYAIGGDDGTPAGALGSVEATPIDIFGAEGDWFAQPVALPGPRTLAGVARIDRFLYLVGGNDGAGPTASVVRAQVLDPLAAPQVVDVAGRRAGAGQGIGAGVWYYRVSAVMADADPSNPGGETLPSDPLVVSLSDQLGANLALTLFWNPVPGAKAYRVYRTPTGAEALGGARRLAEVAGQATTLYEDVAPAGPLAGPPPLPLGATGVWMALPSLAGAREAAGVAAASDPSDPTKWHLYAIGGRGPGPLGTSERLDIAIDPATGAQTPAAAWAADAPISEPRAELTAYAVSHAEAAQVPAGSTYLYAGGGEGSSNVDVALVAAGGALAWAPSNAMSPQRAGYAGVPGAGFLFAFGGAQGNPSDSNASAELDATAVPALVNWNNEGERLLAPRYLAGGAVESAFIYIIGGATTGGPTAAMERTVL